MAASACVICVLNKIEYIRINIVFCSIICNDIITTLYQQNANSAALPANQVVLGSQSHTYLLVEHMIQS